MADFDVAVKITLEHEGGFQKDPNDHANWSSGVIHVGRLMGTKYGITAVDMPGVEIAGITPQQASDFYKGRFWGLYYSQITAQPVANKLFDMGVLFGVGSAIECLQYALDLTPVDGNFGPITLDRCNRANINLLLSMFKTELKSHAEKIAVANPIEASNLDGWINRIDS